MSIKPFSIDLLKGRDKNPETVEVSPLTWLSKLGSISLVVGAASVIASHARDVSIRKEGRRVPTGPRIENPFRHEKRASELSSAYLLNRQGDFRLPAQKRKNSTFSLLAGADNCPGTPIPAANYTAAAPYTDSGNTTGANNTIANYAGSYYYTFNNGPDHIYSFTLTGFGPNPRIEVSTSDSSFNTLVYVLNGMVAPRCPAGTTNGAYAIDVSDQLGGGGTESFNSERVRSFPLNIPLHLVIDSWGYSAPQAGPYTVRFSDVTIAANPIPPANDAPLDMDGDGKSDFVIGRNNGGQLTWYTRGSNDTLYPEVNWGAAGDVFVPAHFDADGKVDIAVWRPGPQGRFYIIRSQTQTLQIEDLGQTGDDPTVVADYSNDGLADLAVYRPGASPGAPSNWYIRSQGGNGSYRVIQFGEHGDKPVPGSYDPYGYYSTELAVRSTSGTVGTFRHLYWWGDIETIQIGLPGDTVVPGDFDGDGVDDFAVVRVNGQGHYVWEFRPSSPLPNSVIGAVWGVAATDVLTPGDYDGDGRTEYSVWRQGNPGTFYQASTFNGNIRLVSWGQTGDVPVASLRVR